MTTSELCERTWRSNQPTRTEDSYRQHRCGFVIDGHLPDGCWCRYCGESTADAAR